MEGFEFEQQTIELIAELQGAQIAMTTMVQALVMAHPDQDRLRDCWDRLSTPRIAANATDAATKARIADRAAAYHFAKWTERLEAARKGA